MTADDQVSLVPDGTATVASEGAGFAPEVLASRIVQDVLGHHRQLRAAVEHSVTLESASGAVLAELRAGLLSSSTAAMLRTTGVPTQHLLGVIQQYLVRGDWRSGEQFGGRRADREVVQAFAQVAEAWQAAVHAAARAVVQARDDVRQQPERFVAVAPWLSAGADSVLPPFLLPQDDYVGARPTAPVVGGRLPAPRRLMDLEVIPGHPWGILPRFDTGGSGVVLVTDEKHFPYQAAVDGIQAMVIDQMSRSAPDGLRITWLDPLEHGRSAGPLLDLVELNSHAIDGAVWSEATDIDSALRRVADRMAELEQRCLRGKFDSLDDYNREANEPPEAHQVVVVTGYPMGFTEAAAQRLERISDNGARLGVSVLVAFHPVMASQIRLVDTEAPFYAALEAGPVPDGAPAWWTIAMLPRGGYVIGHSGGPRALVRTADTGENIGVPCRFAARDDARARRIVDGYARASVDLTHGGSSARELRAKQADPAERVPALRSAMIRWLSTAGKSPEPPGDWADFVVLGAAHLNGVPYSAAEIRQQAEYLHRQGLTHAVSPDGWMSPRLTATGTDLALVGERSLSDFISTSGRSTSMAAENMNIYNAPVFQDRVSGTQIAMNNGFVQQTQTNAGKIAPGYEGLAAVVAEVLAQLPRTGMPADDLADARASAEEILTEVAADQPDRGRIRRALAAVRGFLLPIAQQGALGAGEGVRELAETALHHLQSVTF